MINFWSALSHLILYKTVFWNHLAQRDSILQGTSDSILRLEDGDVPGQKHEHHHLSGTTRAAQPDC